MKSMKEKSLLLLMEQVKKYLIKRKKKGLEVIDASCLDVIKTHDLIQDKLNEGYEICILVKRDILKQKVQFQLMKKEFI